MRGSSPPASAASACRPGSLMRSLSTWPQVLLGGGVRLYGEKRDGSVELERISLGEAEQLTDLRFRILKERPRGPKAALIARLLAREASAARGVGVGSCLGRRLSRKSRAL
jgi:hypothetical protein